MPGEHDYLPRPGRFGEQPFEVLPPPVVHEDEGIVDDQRRSASGLKDKIGQGYFYGKQ